MGNRAKKAYLVGYAQPSGTKGYLVWDPVTDKVEVSRDVIFKEDLGLEPKYQQDPAHLDLLDEESQEDDVEYAVEAIIDERRSKVHTKEYLVKWEGYQEPTWESRLSLLNTTALDDWEN